MLTRRRMLQIVAGAGAGAVGAPLLGAPMINLGRFRLFAGSPQEYSARAIALMGRALVIDMLSPLVISPSAMRKMLSNPDGFAAADLERFRGSGINVFHV
ncbi:MAG: dipeptidase, partial [Candidatus Acidiferrales bacterium]